MAGSLVQVLVYVALPVLLSQTLQGCIQKGAKSTDGRGWVHVVAALKRDGVKTFDVAFMKLSNPEGFVRAYDIERAMKKRKVKVPGGNFQGMIDVLDDNDSGSVDKEDFERMWRKFDLWDRLVALFHKRGLHSGSDAFAAVDRLKTGAIRAEELYWYLETEKEHGMTETICKRMLSVIGPRSLEVGLEENEFDAFFWQNLEDEEDEAGGEKASEEGGAQADGSKAQEEKQDDTKEGQPDEEPRTATVSADALLEFARGGDGPRVPAEQRLARHMT